MRLTTYRPLLAAGALLFAACSPQASAPAPASPDAAVDAACPDDGPRLAITKLCKGRVTAYFVGQPAGEPTPAPDGCTWEVEEVQFPGDEVLLYRGLTCKGVKTQLDFRGGAHSAALGYVTSPMGHSSADEPVRIFTVDAADPQKTLRDLIPEAEAKSCEVAPAGHAFWPPDAVRIAPTAEARARLPKDEPIAACGDFGIDEDSARYWIIRQNYAWFFELGQDGIDVDPATFTLMTKNATGEWQAAP